MVLPGASDRDLRKPEDDRWDSGVRDTKGLRPAVPQLTKILAAYRGVQATSEVTGTEAQLLLLTQPPVLGWVFKGKVPCMHHATHAMWSNWIVLITQGT